MLFTEVIARKRDGHALSSAQIEQFVQGLSDGSLPPEQASALAMAILLNGMTVDETSALTKSMAQSGTTLDWAADVEGPVLDKHSTGGVGDKTSFMVAPIVAACGGFVPMVSGRGLGHTGGTLDKLDSIPGYDSTPDLQRLRQVVKTVGCAIIGQTAELAPADRTLYGIRDITGTVESIPLITASILSKKLAAGNQGLVMDVKAGSGAFMPTVDHARKLAESIVATAKASGMQTHALITDMNQVLGRCAGNGLEIVEAVEYLAGTRREKRLHEVVIALASEMLLVAGLEADQTSAITRVKRVLDNGRAAEIFQRMVAALGGPNDFIENHNTYVPKAAISREVAPRTSGYLSRMDVRRIGNAIVELGGGRRAQDDVLDLSVGLSDVAPLGAEVGPNCPLCMVHAATGAAADRAIEQIRSACDIDTSPPESAPMIYETVKRG